MSGMTMDDLNLLLPTTSSTFEDYENYSYDYPLDVEYEDDSALGKSMNILLVVAYSITFLLGISGNSVVIFITGCKVKKTMKSTWFLNLAITNLIFTLFLPLKITEMVLYHHWPFGKFLCKADNMISVLNMSASAIFLAVITLDYFLTVLCSDLSQKYRTVKTASVIVLLVWTLTIILSAPSFVFIDIEPQNNSKVICIDNYLFSEEDSDDHVDQQTLIHMRESALSITQFLAGYFIPFIIIIACCITMALKIQSCMLTKGGKPFKIIAAMNTVFFICWFPYHIFVFLLLANTDFEDFDPHTKQVINVGNTLSFSLAFFSSCLNPILYFFMGQDFRE